MYRLNNEMFKEPKRYTGWRDYLRNKGFTLIELLVVIVIIGLLAAISYPSYMRHVERTHQTDALNKVSHILKQQQLYFIEHQEYAENLKQLSVPDIKETKHYRWSVDLFKNHRDREGTSHNGARARALPKTNIPGVMGKIWNDDQGVYTVLCKGDDGSKDFMKAKVYCP